MWVKHLNCAKLQSHIAKHRKRKAFWQTVGSQAVQDICQRLRKPTNCFLSITIRELDRPDLRRFADTNRSLSSKLATNSYAVIELRLGIAFISIGIPER